jgi:hypothetical protein
MAMYRVGAAIDNRDGAFVAALPFRGVRSHAAIDIGAFSDGAYEAKSVPV